jgi:hypothetical protein
MTDEPKATPRTCRCVGEFHSHRCEIETIQSDRAALLAKVERYEKANIQGLIITLCRYHDVAEDHKANDGKHPNCEGCGTIKLAASALKGELNA